MTDIFQTHNPHPLNIEEDAVCCKRCCDGVVGLPNVFNNEPENSLSYKHV